MGHNYTRVLSLMKGIKLVGVADINIERGVETATRYQVKFFEDYRDLLPHADAVCIAVLTILNHTVSVNCLRAGIHVLIEKLIAKSVSEAESLIKSRCILLVGQTERFSPTFQELCKVLKTEELLALETRRMNLYTNRANYVSVILYLMIHDIDLLLEIAAASVTKRFWEKDLGTPEFTI
ncbi:oxidoreductase, Gfo/Idh/MocA family [Richelia intracellularis HH01]|uniref:Oxidoreductase, Gfo/Idh/MocA family n=1 Tax=Richelia intracellularis HH01 TaxID=1165094 RepID=M1X047_9NOST|nr:oxidoreductase, Gfo/Idh/MocA family [Richelia intracellularis HH01]